MLGLNGAGKSTLLRIMAGIDTDIEGEARPQPGIKIGYLPQEPKLNPEQTVREAVEEAVSEVKNALTRLDEIYAAYAEPDADFDKLAKQQGEMEAIIQSHDGHNLDNQLERAADALRLPPWDAKIEHLSGGERRRVALCRLLLEKPDMLLLDEPTNHLDAESVAWLERFLHDYEGTVVAITHDRYFLDNVAGWILELDRGEGIPWEGNYSSWLEQKDKRLEQEASSEAARRKSIEKELEWVRQNPKGRQAKSKARLARFDELNSVEYQKRNETSELFIPPGPRLGDKVLEVQNLKKSYGDRLLIEDLSFTIPKGAIVGIIGPNGAGKSTLFRMISGQEQPDSGTITLGDTVKIASVDQFRDSMDNSKTVWEEVSGGLDIMRIGNFELPSRAYVGRFNFKGTDQGKRVGELSGGERGRLHLAKLLQVGGNMLLLDEPTNDLDIETLRALENALLEFPGCAMVISHDRWFLDRIATHILDYGDEGKVEFFEGNFTEYEDWKKRTLGAEALEPHRIKYKKIAK
ncbi:energy-dependent translational throttle protein EttA [Escherichia coli]|nr:energy-dependent translational throttle protein EttA [Escherichia coli]BBT56118.1 energy-dependent translational throttle protein EttA [Escherichia coli]